MRDMDNYKDYFNEVTKHCNYWELGFGDLCTVEETEIVRQCFIDGNDADEACDAWRDFVMEHMYEKAL